LIVIGSLLNCREFYKGLGGCATKWRIHQVYAAFGNLAMPD
jgi:hypothetical protein